MLKKIEIDDRNWTDVFFTANDGLRLYARDYGSRLDSTTPLLCLPGLTRNSKDFHDLATYLSTHPTSPRRVVCADYRGRGRSEYDRNWRNYSPEVEVRDVFDLLPAVGLTEVVVAGTSRGGILAMVMAAMRPGILAGVILNDIGPEFGTEGLARIKGYVGKMPSVADWADASNLMRTMNEHHFPGLNENDWLRFTQRTFVEIDGQIRLDYDKRLARQLDAIDLAKPIPALWPQFDALKALPVMAIRGTHSDLLEPDTLDRMAAHHPGLDVIEVADAGHAPFLDDPSTLKRIISFLRKIDH